VVAQGLGIQIDGTANAELGRAIAGPGDTNGDGLADIVVSADTNAGPAVYVIYGSPTRQINVATLSPSQGYLIQNNDRNSSFGSTLAGVSDFNGDGLADFAIGAPTSSQHGQTDAGRVYVVYGVRGTATSPLSLQGGDGGVDYGARDLRIEGPGPNAMFGSSIAGVGDVNGDGRSDLVVGAPGQATSAAPKRAAAI